MRTAIYSMLLVAAVAIVLIVISSTGAMQACEINNFNDTCILAIK